METKVLNVTKKRFWRYLGFVLLLNSIYILIGDVTNLSWEQTMEKNAFILVINFFYYLCSAFLICLMLIPRPALYNKSKSWAISYLVLGLIELFICLIILCKALLEFSSPGLLLAGVGLSGSVGVLLGMDIAKLSRLADN